MNSYALGIAVIFVLIIGVLLVPAESSNIPPTPAFTTIQTNDTMTVTNVTANTYNDLLKFETDGTITIDAVDSSYTDPFPEWEYRVKLTVSKDMTPGNLTNFPLYVPVTFDLFPGSPDLGTGDDIFFTKSDGVTKLNFDKANWDVFSETGYFWVQTNVTNVADTEIYMYYDGLTTHGNDPCVIWDDGSYFGVFHMGNVALDENAVCGEPGTVNNGATRVVTDQSGKYGASFDGISDYVNLNDSTVMEGNYNGTLSAWVELDNLTSDHSMIAKKRNGDGSFILTFDDVGTNTDMYSCWIKEGNSVGGTSAVVESATNSATTDWQYVACTFALNDPNGLNLYVDGAVTSTSPVSTVGMDNIQNNAQTIRFGNTQESSARYMDGEISQIRLSENIKSANWIKAEYNNQVSQTILATYADRPYITLGDIESLPVIIDDSITLSVDTVALGFASWNEIHTHTDNGTAVAETPNSEITFDSYDDTILITSSNIDLTSSISNGTYSADYKISNTTGNFDGLTGTFGYFGSAVSNIGDLDGDGITDLAVGERNVSSGLGQLHILMLNGNYTVKEYQTISDTDGNFTATFDSMEQLGASIDNIGDLDGDSITDIIVGSGLDGANASVFYMYLHNNGTVKNHDELSLTPFNFDYTSNGTDIGEAVSVLGDFDGNGITDLILGDPTDDVDGTDRGAVYIAFLNSTLQVDSYQKISDSEGGFDATFDNEDFFGTSTTAMGDINGDGITDIAVGAPEDDDGGTSKGAVYVIFLNEDATVKSYQKISDTQGNFTAPIDITAFFGQSVTNMGDLDSNGVNDMLVGAIFDDNIDATGTAYTIFLNGDGTVKDWKKIGEGSGGFTFDLDSNDRFGSAVESLGDFDGDGITDMVISAMYDGDGGALKGAIYLGSAASDLIANVTDTINFVLNSPESDRLGGVKAQSCSGGNYMVGIDTNGEIICAP